MTRSLIICICCVLIASTNASTKTAKDFDNYVEGALTVYSQFKTPSKKESEEFYKFVKSKWSSTQCTSNCAKVGVLIGAEYAEKKNIEIKTNK